MGMYTELVCSFHLKNDTPTDVRAVLDHMIQGGEEDPMPSPLPDHPLFKAEVGRWVYMLQCSSFYFAANEPLSRRMSAGSSINYAIWCNLKNYEREIELFLDWIAPYIDRAEGGHQFLGYLRYEEFTDPTLIYIENGKIELLPFSKGF